VANGRCKLILLKHLLLLVVEPVVLLLLDGQGVAAVQAAHHIILDTQ